MKIAVWKTNHEIADTIADAISNGIPQAVVCNTTTDFIFSENYDVNIAYGILRGTANVFENNWFVIDRGYFLPDHFNGFYRVSLRGTQQTGFWPEPDYARLAKLNLDIKPWRGFDKSKPVLVCPPTDAVRDFFNDGMPMLIDHCTYNCVVRKKGDSSPIIFDDYNYVLTFNSSVGWQALMAGIPCVSDPIHSIVGSYFSNEKLSENLADMQYKHRMRLFGCMSSLQLTLEEMREGKLWPLMERLISGSDSMAGSHHAHTSPPTPSTSAQTQN